MSCHVGVGVLMCVNMYNTLCYAMLHVFQPCDSNPDTVVDFAKRRLQLAESLYYKSLENIILDERQRRSAQDNFLVI